MPTDFQRITRLTLAVGLALPVSGQANPQGEAVRHGAVTFERADGQLKVLQATDKAIIDWQSFSIGSGELTQFVQPGSRSAALNRVRGPDASRIDGALRANGQLYLLNPAGIIVGPGGTIDAAGFTASTLDLPDEAFLAGGDLQFRGASQAGVVNLGSITAFEGDVFLIASTVENAGTIRAPRGTAGLAAGNDVLIRQSGDERVFVRGASGSHGDGVNNTGTIEANIAELKAHGGNVYAMAIRNEGRIAATGITKEGGQIFLRAPGGKIKTTGTLKALRSDHSGGRAIVDTSPRGTTEVGGTVDVAGESGKGGEVQILGQEIQVMPGAVIIADGPAGGGSIFIGGGPLGQDADKPNAQNVTIAPGAEIRANATGNGSGGQIVVFAADTLRFEGHASATGGPLGGNGGAVELSGKNRVIMPGLLGSVDVSAPRGTGGSLLFDPINVSIQSGSGGTITGSPVSLNTLYANDIAAFLQSVGSLVIDTSSGTGTPGDGDITLQTNANISWNSGNQLTFNANNNFTMSASTAINSLGGGNVTVNAARAITLNTGSGITTTTGSIFLNANQGPPTEGNFVGITLNGATLNASGSGNIELHGTGGDTGNSNVGILLQNLLGQIQTTNGDILLDGVGGSSTGTGNRGVVMQQGSSVRATGSGSIFLTGVGGAAGSQFNDGILLSDASTLVEASTGSIQLMGTGGAGSNHAGVGITAGADVRSTGTSATTATLSITGLTNTVGGNDTKGVAIVTSGTEITSHTADIVINGNAGSGANLSDGVYLRLAQIRSLGSGTDAATISITGTGGSGAGTKSGVSISGVGTEVRSLGGAITIQGGVSSGNNRGLTLAEFLIQAGSGNIHLQGQGSGTGLAIEAIVPSATLGNGSETLILKSLGGDVTLSNAITTNQLQLLDHGGADAVAFTLTNAANDINVIAGNGNGPLAALGSLDFSDQDGFTVGSVLGVNGITASGDVILTSMGGTEAVNISGGISSDGGLIGITGYDIAATLSPITNTGSGEITFDATRSITLKDDASVTAVDGAISMNANVSSLEYGGFSGIVIDGSAVSTSGSGGIFLTGGGGNAAVSSPTGVDGILVTNGSTITSTGTATSAGDILLVGTGGAGDLAHAGVRITGTGSSIGSIDGLIEIYGYGMDSTVGHGIGVLLENHAVVESSGLAEIIVEGSGGGIGSGNIGTFLDSNAAVRSLGAGNLTITGFGGDGNDQSDGIRMASGTSVTVSNGLLTMNGTAGPILGKGLDIFSTAGAIGVTGNGSVDLTGSGTGAPGVDLQNASVGGPSANLVKILATDGGMLLGSETTAASDITLQSMDGLLQVTALVTSQGGDLLLKGPQIITNAAVSAAAGELQFAIDDLGTATSGSIAINAGFTGNTLLFTGGAGPGDQLTFAGQAGPVSIQADTLTDIEFLTGSASLNDQFEGPALAATYQFTGPNNFSVGPLTVSSFENVTGGADDDVFSLITSTAFLTGLLDGGGGVNELDYSSYPTGAAVDLALGTATGLGGGFVNISTFNGSPNIDTLTGPGTASSFEFFALDTFRINGGIDVYDFENVIGGAGDDDFKFLAGSGLSGYLDGGTDSSGNQIDYSLFNAPVTVNLGPVPGPPAPAQATATAIAGGVSNVSRFIGSTGATDTFLGPQAGSTFNITGPDAFNVGTYTATAFENLTGGGGADVFNVLPAGNLRGLVDGGGGANTLNYSSRGSTVTVDVGAGLAPGFAGFRNIGKFIGTSGSDLLIGTPQNDIFSITADAVGSLNGTTLFEAFDRLDGIAGNDQFNFLNQAQVGSVFGGTGSDLLFINDSNFTRGGIYNITEGSITRNPSYNFSSIETVRLLLGPGNDTVNTRFTSFAQILDGGGGSNILNLNGSQRGGTGQISQGGAGSVSYTNFNTPGTLPDAGGLLQLQLDLSLGILSGQQALDPFTVQNLFSSGTPQGFNSLTGLLGGAFAGAVAGQSAVLLIDGTSYLQANAFSLDGLGLTPSNFILQSLGNHLLVTSQLELLQALEDLSGIFLTYPDGAFGMDLSGQPVPAPLQALLMSHLQAAAAFELSQALGIQLVVLLTPIDGALTIDTSGQAPPQAILLILAGHLTDTSFGELSAALDAGTPN